jgi:catechol 2,3-dioxygenase-like lactoylglutathione lyase family enzyme
LRASDSATILSDNPFRWISTWIGLVMAPYWCHRGSEIQSPNLPKHDRTDNDTMATVRYFAADVSRASNFYVAHLGFQLLQQYGPAMAILERDDLTLWMAGPSASASRPMIDGSQPVPGGWNRLVIPTDDLDSLVERLRTENVVFRNDIVTGPGGRQILIEDSEGNPIELFEAA